MLNRLQKQDPLISLFLFVTSNSAKLSLIFLKAVLNGSPSPLFALDPMLITWDSHYTLPTTTSTNPCSSPSLGSYCFTYHSSYYGIVINHSVTGIALVTIISPFSTGPITLQVVLPCSANAVT